MRLISEIVIDIKKGLFPQFIFDLYKSGCEIQNINFVEKIENNEKFNLEVSYKNRSNFIQFIDQLDNFPKKYKIISLANALEDKIKGGLLKVTGKLPLENIFDYEIGILGATELIYGKIKKGAGIEHTGISRNVGILCCVKDDNDKFSNNVLKVYINAERDSVLISNFTNLTPLPVIIKFNLIDDLIKSIQSIENTYSILRFNHVDEFDITLYDRIYSDLDIPVISHMFDDVPIYLLTLAKKILTKNKLKPEEITIGIIGINSTALRISRICHKSGFYKVLGYDHNESIMLSFEKNEGLATTVENIFSNADIIILFKNIFSPEDCQNIRPGQYFISLLKDNEIDNKIIVNRGIREFVDFNKLNLSALYPGLLMGILNYKNNFLDDDKIIDIAEKLTKLLVDNYSIPNVFTDIHKKIELLFKDK